MLGICLGLQVLFEESEEFGNHRGLGFIKGRVRRFRNDTYLKIPHIGWNSVKIRKTSPIFNGIKDGEYFYFVHSYYVEPEDPDTISTTTEYGGDFCSSIQIENIFASQFHPEKSQSSGLRLIENFIKHF